jgi:cold shock CspA family protein
MAAGMPSCTYPTSKEPVLSSLNEGAKVSYEIVANQGKESAENLKVG